MYLSLSLSNDFSNAKKEEHKNAERPHWRGRTELERPAIKRSVSTEASGTGAAVKSGLPKKSEQD